MALKIFGEKRNQRMPKRALRFYVTDAETDFANLADPGIQAFVQRMQRILEEASGQYEAILGGPAIDWRSADHVRAVVAACKSFQDFSFVRSAASDLYQLVFYNFANKFQQQEKAQFLTPLPIIKFLVELVNPRNAETVLDPCCGIADFLSLSYIHARAKEPPGQLDGANIYGADLSPEMITLASLNMLLNGDGNAHLFHVPDKGSIVWKIACGNCLWNACA